MNSNRDCFHQLLPGLASFGKPLIEAELAKSNASPETITFNKAAEKSPPNNCAKM